MELRRIRKVVGAGVVVAGAFSLFSMAGPIGAGVASADPGGCYNAVACMWDHTNYSGAGIFFGNNQGEFTTLPHPGGGNWNDRNLSTFNGGPFFLNSAWWANAGFTGYLNCNSPGDGESNDNNLATGWFSTFANTASSINFFSTTPSFTVSTCSSWN